MSTASSLRDQMPAIATWVDELRTAFGRAEIDAVIRRGLQGEPGKFHARENGCEIGTPFPVRPTLTVDQFLKLGRYVGPPEKK